MERESVSKMTVSPAARLEEPAAAGGDGDGETAGKKEKKEAEPPRVSLWIIKETLPSRVEANVLPVYRAVTDELAEEPAGWSPYHDTPSPYRDRSRDPQPGPFQPGAAGEGGGALNSDGKPPSPRGAFLASVRAQALMPVPLPLTTIYHQPTAAGGMVVSGRGRGGALPRGCFA